MKSTVLFASLVIASAMAAAQTVTAPSTGKYFQDLKRLMTEVRGVQWSTQLCGETFPERKIPAEGAYAQWREKYARFIDEMEGELHKAGAMVTQDVEGQRDDMRKRFLDLGSARFSAVCAAIPGMLASEKYDFEASRSALVETIRAGPNARPENGRREPAHY